MAAPVSLVILLPNGRRQTVKTNRNSSILQIIEDVCKKHQLNASEYELVHGNRRIDPSHSIHYANIPNNAQLELKAALLSRHATSVVIGLQLESGERLVAQFEPCVSLWDIVCHWVKQKERAEILKESNGVPVCIYMRKEIMGKEELQNTTLQKLGLTGGNAVIRLLFRPLEVLSGQAHVSSNFNVPFKKDTEPSGPSSVNVQRQRPSSPAKEQEKSLVKNSSPERKTRPEPLPTKIHVPPVQLTENFQTRPAVVSSDFCKNTTTVDPRIVAKEDIILIGERQAVLFNLEQCPPIAVDDPDEEFFELTLEDAKYLAEEYKRKRLEMESRPLETAEMRKRREKERERLYIKAVLRVYFPDRLVLQGSFTPQEKVSDVYKFVQGFLRKGDLPFYLYTAPPKRILNMDDILLKAGLVPAAVVHFGVDKEYSFETFIKDEYLCQISTPGGASRAAAQCRSVSSASDQETNVQQVDVPVGQPVMSPPVLTLPSHPVRRATSKGDQEKKVPKWFALGKK